jgi:hypothetical protein
MSEAGLIPAKYNRLAKNGKVQSPRCQSRESLVIAASEFVRGLGHPAGLFVFLEADAAQDGRDRKARAAGRRHRKSGRTDDRWHLGVAVAVLGSQEHDATIAPPEAESNDAGNEEAADREEDPVLAHL